MKWHEQSRCANMQRICRHQYDVVYEKRIVTNTQKYVQTVAENKEIRRMGKGNEPSNRNHWIFCTHQNVRIQWNKNIWIALFFQTSNLILTESRQKKRIVDVCYSNALIERTRCASHYAVSVLKEKEWYICYSGLLQVAMMNNVKRKGHRKKEKRAKRQKKDQMNSINFFLYWNWYRHERTKRGEARLILTYWMEFDPFFPFCNAIIILCVYCTHFNVISLKVVYIFAVKCCRNHQLKAHLHTFDAMMQWQREKKV